MHSHKYIHTHIQVCRKMAYKRYYKYIHIETLCYWWIALHWDGQDAHRLLLNSLSPSLFWDCLSFVLQWLPNTLHSTCAPSHPPSELLPVKWRQVQHPWWGQKILSKLGLKEKTTYISKTVFSSNSASFVPNHLCIHLFQGKSRTVATKNEYVLWKWNALCLSTVLEKYYILPPMASCPNLSPLNIPQGLTATVKCIDGCFSQLLYLLYI